MDKSPDQPILPGLLGVNSIETSQNQMSSSNAWRIPLQLNLNSPFKSGDTSLFSSSLPVFPHQNLTFPDSGTGTPSNDENTPTELKDDLGINYFLPDEEELFSNLLDDVEPPAGAEELEEYDVFGTGGGMELEESGDLNPLEGITVGFARSNLSDLGFGNNNVSQFGIGNNNGVNVSVAGEHPFGEHPSRTLFVRNINSNVEDSELKSMFEQYGAIRTLYTATKHRGFVMISYYDIRDARNAMRGLQNKPLRRRKLDIHFSIPKDNPSDKDLNQGTLVIFNLDPSVSNEELRLIFGTYGEVKEIRETPHKRHHKFIEFYDVRAADAALRALNKSEIAGKRIKLEPSRPGGARRNLMQQLTHDMDSEEARLYRHHVGSPIGNSPPGAWAFNSPTENSPLQSAYSKSPGGSNLIISPIGSLTNNNNPFPISSLQSAYSNSPGGSTTNNLISSFPTYSSSPAGTNNIKIAPIGKDSNRANNLDHTFAHSFPENSRANETATPGGLTGPQFLWGSPKPYSDQSSSWQSPPAVSSSFLSSNHNPPPGFLYGRHTPHQHNVGSAPSGMPFETHFGFFPESPTSNFLNKNNINNMNNMNNLSNFNMLSNNLSKLRMMSQQQGRVGPPAWMGSPSSLSNSPYNGYLSNMVGFEAMINNRRVEMFGQSQSQSQLESRKQYQLDLDKIMSGEDSRTTLMIKNIPNKYTSKMLLAAIDEKHKGTYDFFYLPIDFKNKCNVGYAFINMSNPSHIISFYEAFNGKKWEKFNSEKVASLAYARIQGRTALISHFQNSSLMNEDKRCRPILFHSQGPEAGNREPFPLDGINGISLQDDAALEDWA
ncbi:hypothetical protein LUZ60_009698 [Juncus effusus]|nr:hypothetical protein LUZ60_009698 [Juncus effusus]